MKLILIKRFFRKNPIVFHLKMIKAFSELNDECITALLNDGIIKDTSNLATELVDLFRTNEKELLNIYGKNKDIGFDGELIRGVFGDDKSEYRYGMYFGPSGTVDDGKVKFRSHELLEKFYYGMKLIAIHYLNKICTITGLDPLLIRKPESLENEREINKEQRDSLTVAFYKPISMGGSKINWHIDIGLISVALSNKPGFECKVGTEKVNGEVYEIYVHLGDWLAAHLAKIGVKSAPLWHFGNNKSNEERIFIGLFLESHNDSKLERISMSRINEKNGEEEHKLLTDTTYREFCGKTFSYINESHEVVN